MKSSSSHSNIKEILRAAFITGKLTVVRIIVGFGRSKLNALILGAAGLGLYSQANYFSLFLTSICSLGLVNGMMQRISYNRERALHEEQKQVQATVLTTQLFLLALVVLSSVLFAGIINKELFNGIDKQLNVLILVLVAGTFFTVLSSNYMEGFFFSYGRYDLYTKASIVATVVGFLLFIPLIYFFGVYGAFASIAVAGLCLFASYLFYIQKIEKLSNVFVFGFRKKIFLNILPEGLINLFYGTLVPFSALIIRNLMIRYEGPAENGLYQICTSITALYVPFLTNPLWAKLFPEVSAKGPSKEANSFFYNALLFTTIVSGLCVMALFIKPDWIIYVLSSKEFVGSVKFFPVYFLGDFCFNILFAYAVYLLALRRVKEYFIMWIAFFLIQFLASRFLIEKTGGIGIPLGYMLAALLLVFYVFTALYKTLEKRFNSFMFVFAITVLAILIEGYFLHQHYSFLLKLSIMILWAASIFYWQKDFIKALKPRAPF